MSSSPFSTSSISNPFTASPFDRKDDDEGVVAATAPEGSYTYAMVPSHPAVDASEVETNVAALEVTVKWGANVLHVAHLSPIRSFSVGEELCDFTVSRDMIGADRVEVVRVEGGAVIVPSLGKKLEGDAKESVAIGALTFDVKCTKAGRKVAGAMKINKRAVGLGAMAALLHGGLFAAMFAFTPSLDNTDPNEMSSEQSAKVAMMFQAMADKEHEAIESEKVATDDGSRGGESGEKAKGAEGQAGTTAPTKDRGHYAIKGNEPKQMLSRAEAIKDAQDFGMIGLLTTLTGDTNTMSASWANRAQGNDPLSANGDMWSDSLGASGGFGGMGLSSDGLGGGGRGENVGLGDIGTGHSMGNCIGPMCSGIGVSTGVGRDGHSPTAPKVRQKPVEGSSRIPAEVIQRVIQRNFGRFRACYDVGLKTNPALAGRVSVALTIGADGAVSSAANAGSDLPDASVVSCIVRNFGGLNFPAPDAMVRIVYPLMLSPN